MARKEVVTAFPIGAWIRDESTEKWFGGIEQTMRGPRFVPTGGEIVSIGKLGPSPVYSIKFAESRNFVFLSNAVCYMCRAACDATHAEGCIEPQLRAIPHEPGYSG